MNIQINMTKAEAVNYQLGFKHGKAGVRAHGSSTKYYYDGYKRGKFIYDNKILGLK